VEPYGVLILHDTLALFIFTEAQTRNVSVENARTLQISGHDNDVPRDIHRRSCHHLRYGTR